MKILQKTIPALFVLATLFGCNIGTSGIAKNNDIEKETRDQIKELNDRLFQAIIADDPDAVRALMSDDLLKKQSQEEIDALLKQLSGALQELKVKKYHVMDEYYVGNLHSGALNTIPSGRFDESNYTIDYKALNKETYVSLLLPEGSASEILLLLVYGKKGNTWKINIFQFGQYSVYNKTAPQYYKLAKDCYHHSEMIDAVTNIILAKQCLTPGGEIFSYQKEKEINEFYDKVMKEANAQYPLPRIMENIETKPELFLVTPELLEDGVFPLVCYISKIDLEDTVALKLENDQVKIEVNQLFSGINRNKKRVLYRAYNEMPDAKKKVKYYGFLDELSY